MFDGRALYAQTFKSTVKQRVDNRKKHFDWMRSRATIVYVIGVGPGLTQVKKRHQIVRAIMRGNTHTV